MMVLRTSATRSIIESNHSNNEFAKSKNHINDVENFWAIAKTKLSKYRGISKKTFYLHLKEC